MQFKSGEYGVSVFSPAPIPSPYFHVYQWLTGIQVVPLPKRLPNIRVQEPRFGEQCIAIESQSDGALSARARTRVESLETDPRGGGGSVSRITVGTSSPY